MIRAASASRKTISCAFIRRLLVDVRLSANGADRMGFGDLGDLFEQGGQLADSLGQVAAERLMDGLKPLTDRSNLLRRQAVLGQGPDAVQP